MTVFCSSIRRHTRSKRDWSSDVCSSDLNTPEPDHVFIRDHGPYHNFSHDLVALGVIEPLESTLTCGPLDSRALHARLSDKVLRSEERRVGNGSSGGGWRTAGPETARRAEGRGRYGG